MRIFLLVLLANISIVALAQTPDAMSDSLAVVIQELGLLDCNEPGGHHVPTSPEHTFAFQNDGNKLVVKESSFSVSWHLPEGSTFQGNFYLIVKTFFDKYLDLIITPEKTVSLDLKQYRFNWEKDGVVLELYREGCEKAESIAVVKE